MDSTSSNGTDDERGAAAYFKWHPIRVSNLRLKFPT